MSSSFSARTYIPLYKHKRIEGDSSSNNRVRKKPRDSFESNVSMIDGIIGD